MALKQLTRLLFGIQRQLLPALEEALGPLDAQEQRFVKVLELLKLEKHVDQLGWKGNGRHKTIFSRAFAAYAHIGLGQSVHAALISEQLGQEVIEHAATDGTAIEARESVQPAEEAGAEPAPPKRKRGRPRKGEATLPPEPTRLQRHLEHRLEDNLKDMPPVHCDWGCKTNSQGNTDCWRGYKLHLITGDGDIPLSAYVSSASLLGQPGRHHPGAKRRRAHQGRALPAQGQRV